MLQGDSLYIRRNFNWMPMLKQQSLAALLSKLVSLAATELRDAPDPTMALPMVGVILHFVSLGLDVFVEHQSDKDRDKLEDLVRRVLIDLQLSDETIQNELVVMHFDADQDRERILARLKFIRDSQNADTDQLVELCQQNLDMWPTFERFLLHQFDRLHSEIGAPLNAIKTDLHVLKSSAPPLEPRIYRRGHSDNILRYQFREVPFVGRQQEMQALRDWLDTPDIFSWWNIEAPGGAGKSRLAQEFCLNIQNEWHAGFINLGCGFDYNKWTPTHPTLFVVDYAANLGSEVRTLCCALERAASRSTHRLRLILLDRPASINLKKSLSRSGDGQIIIENCRHHTTPLTIGPLDDDDIWQVMESVTHQQDFNCPLPDRNAAMAELRQIDPLCRPLFATFAGLALARGEAIGHWDAAKLTTWVVERWRDAYWLPAGCSDTEEHLLALATLMDGITENHANQISNMSVVDILPKLNHIETKQRHEVMTGSIYFDSLAPLEPDILGERFVLDMLKPSDSFWGHDKVDNLTRKLRDTVWEVNPIKLIEFCKRAHRDFPKEPVIIELLYTGSPCPNLPADVKAQALEQRGCLKAELGDLEGVLADYRAVLALPDLSIGDRCSAIHSLGWAMDNLGDLDSAIEAYEVILSMPDTPLWNKACTMVNRAAAKGKQGDWDFELEVYDTIDAMADAPLWVKSIASYNRGCVNALGGQLAPAIEALCSWKNTDHDATKKDIDEDDDFDLIRHKPEFVAFRDTLPN